MDYLVLAGGVVGFYVADGVSAFGMRFLPMSERGFLSAPWILRPRNRLRGVVVRQSTIAVELASSQSAMVDRQSTTTGFFKYAANKSAGIKATKSTFCASSSDLKNSPPTS